MTTKAPRLSEAAFLCGAAVLAAVLMVTSTALAEPRWMTLPPTPSPVSGETLAHARIDGIDLSYATIGAGPPVVLLQGGLANSDYWGHQVRALMAHHRVILVDSRGQGRSSRDARPFGYDLMADDVVGLLDVLKIEKADIVGWSDGAILGLDLAIRHPERVTRVFAYAANAVASGVEPDAASRPTSVRFMARAADEYRRLSPTPGRFDALVADIGRMWDTQPSWSDATLRTIRVPVEIAAGDHDEIKRAHTEHLAATIPGAGLLILPNTSHFAFLQAPELFNAAMVDFLDGPAPVIR